MKTTAVIAIRKVDAAHVVLDVGGELSGQAEEALTAAYEAAVTPQTRVIVLNFAGLEYMNSAGIGLLVTLLVRANRQKIKLLAVGLNEHYRHILNLTRLDEAIGIFASEGEALAAG